MMKKLIPGVFFQKKANGPTAPSQRPARLELFQSELATVTGGILPPRPTETWSYDQSPATIRAFCAAHPGAIIKPVSQRRSEALEPAVRPTPAPVAPEAPPPQAPAQYVGVIFAPQLVDMAARSDGRLEAIYAHLGEHLKPGDVVAKVESNAITQQLDMAEATLRSAQAEVRSASVELQDAEVRHHRRERLVNAGLLSKEELATARVQVERPRSNLEVAQARVAEQQARVRQTKEALANTVITAAFEGTVAARYLDPGAMVHVGSPVIKLMRSDDLWVRFAAPEEVRLTLPMGASVSVRLARLPEAIPGTIAHIAPGVDTVSREVIVEAKLQVPAAWRGQMRPGLSGDVTATGTPRSDVGPTPPRKAAVRAR
jgi:RND family efflux transporter MFP subunit